MRTKPETRNRTAYEVIPHETEKRTLSLQKSAKANDRTWAGINLNEINLNEREGMKGKRTKTSMGPRPLPDTQKNDLVLYIQKYSGSLDVPSGETIYTVNSKYKCALEYRTKVKINPYDFHFGGMVKWKAQILNPVFPSQSKLAHQFRLLVYGYARLQFSKLRKWEYR